MNPSEAGLNEPRAARQPAAPPTVAGAGAPASFVTRALSAYFGDHEVVKGIDLEMKPQVITAIIGPSGCGKTTFIRCLNRMHELMPGARVEGEVILHGQNVYAPQVDPVALRRRIGMVFQKPNPFPSMSVAENVLAGLALTRRLERGRAEEIVESTLRRAALWDEVKDRLKEPGTGLSGGQQQRLCIARALAVEPHILLMDEPCSALDPVATARIEELMHQLRERYTIVIVTHNMQQAARVSQYTAFLLSGELIEFDQTDKLFTNPANSRTEDYITGKFG
jgi:phosphate transport system ATP-binding protein